MPALVVKPDLVAEAPTVSHFFTFGQVHMTSFTLPIGGRLADYWVKVKLPADHRASHRAVFVELFTTRYCPSPDQFGFEYVGDDFAASYFPAGLLCTITENGIERNGDDS